MIEIIDSVDGVKSLEAGWQLLGRLHPSPLFQYQWFLQAAESFQSGDQRLQLFVLRNQDGSVTAIAPLVLSAERFGPCLTFLGARQLFEPACLLYRDRASLTELVRALIRNGYPLNLTRFQSDQFRRQDFQAMVGSGGIVLSRPEIPSPYLPISGNWMQFEKSLTSTRRQRLSRAARRAAEFGQVDLDVGRISGDQVEESLVLFGDVEGRSWKGREGSALAQNPQQQHFFTNYLKEMASNQGLVFGRMRLSGQPVAAQLAVIYENNLWILKTCFVEEFARCSPGVLLMHQFVRFAFEQQLDSVEFLGRHENWLEIWTKKVHQYATIRIIPVSFNGISFCLRQGLGYVRRKALSGRGG